MAIRMKSPYVGISAGPVSMMGIYKPVMLTREGVSWLNKEPNLDRIKEYIEEHEGYDGSNISMGIMTPSVVDTFIREAIKNNKIPYSEKEKKKAKERGVILPTKYQWTDTMKSIFKPSSEYLLLTGIRKFVYSLIDKNV